MSGEPVSVLGLGLMGAAFAKAFITAGAKVTVWNRTAAKADPLKALGATVATTVAACVRASRIIIAVIISPEVLQELLNELESSDTEGRILVDFTTGSPALTAESSARAARAGFLDYLHGAILAMPHQIGTPRSVYLVSGKHDVYLHVEPHLKALGSLQHISADDNASALLELILIGTLYGVASGFLQTVAMLKKTSLFKEEGIQTFMKTLWIPYVNGVAAEFFSDTGRQMDENDFVTKGEGAKCSQQVHALESLIRTSKELGVSGKLMEPILDLFRKRTEQGHGEDEISGLVELV